MVHHTDEKPKLNHPKLYRNTWQSWNLYSSLFAVFWHLAALYSFLKMAFQLGCGWAWVRVCVWGFSCLSDTHLNLTRLRHSGLWISLIPTALFIWCSLYTACLSCFCVPSILRPNLTLCMCHIAGSINKKLLPFYRSFQSWLQVLK